MPYPNDFTVFEMITDCDELDIDIEIANLKTIITNQNVEIIQLQNTVTDLENNKSRNWKIFI